MKKKFENEPPIVYLHQVKLIFLVWKCLISTFELSVCFSGKDVQEKENLKEFFWRIFWWIFLTIFWRFFFCVCVCWNAWFLHLNSSLFFRERRSRKRESQRNGRRVLGHGLNRDPSVPEGHPRIFPSSKTWVSARLTESHFNHPVSGSGPPCTNRTLPHLYGHRFADAHFTRCWSWPSGQPFFIFITIGSFFWSFEYCTITMSAFAIFCSKSIEDKCQVKNLKK